MTPVRIVSEIEWRRIRWWAVLLTGTLLVLAFSIALPQVTLPLLIALAVGYVVNPITTRLRRWRLGRNGSAAVVFAGCTLLLGGTLAALGPAVVDQVTQLPDATRALLRRLGTLGERWGLQLPATIPDTIETLTRQLRSGGGDPRWITGLFGQTAGLLGRLSALLTTPFFAFFLIRDYDRFVVATRRLIPVTMRPSVVGFFRDYDRFLGGFLRGQLLVACILAVLYAIGFLLVGTPIALSLALISGLGNLIPYLGTAIGLLMATAAVLLEGLGWTTLLLTYAVFVAVQTIEGWYVTPKIVGTSVGMSPFWVVLSILIMGSLFGLVGVILAVPAAGIVQIIVQRGYARYERSPLFRAEDQSGQTMPPG